MEYDHFKMDTVKQAIELVTPGCYFASIDFTSAYYSVPIRPADRKYLRFIWQGQAYQFTVLAQGLSTAPRIYTKMLKPAFAAMRDKGFTVLGYIDDTILIENNAEEIEKSLQFATKLFDDLGMTISVKKSVLQPVQRIEYLGFIIDSTDMTVCLTDAKKQKIHKLACKLLKKSQFSIRELAAFIGNVVASEHGVLMVPFHYKNLEVERNKYLLQTHSNWDAIVSNNDVIKNDLLWWKQTILDSKRDIIPPPVNKTLYSDSSMKGWGGHTCTTAGDSTGGDWNEVEQSKHINELELLAAFFTLKCFCSQDSQIHVRLIMDNTTAIACVNNYGSMKLHLLKLAHEMFNWALSRNILLSAGYIPGVENILADRESRTRNLDAEWKLKPKWFEYIVSQFGNPDIDLFASRVNYQMKPYVAWRPDPEALFIDAFSESWSSYFSYIFPPFSVMSRVLRKLITDDARAIVIHPEWPQQIWFPRLQKLKVGLSIKLPWNCLEMPQKQSEVHPLNKKLHLRASLLLGSNIVIKD